LINATPVTPHSPRPGTPPDWPSAPWWVDPDLRTLPLPDLIPGVHTLEVETAFGPRHNVDPNHYMEVPHSWCLAPEVYSPEYRVTEAGILSGPLLEACDHAAGQG